MALVPALEREFPVWSVFSGAILAERLGLAVVHVALEGSCC